MYKDMILGNVVYKSEAKLHFEARIKRNFVGQKILPLCFPASLLAEL